MSIEQIREDIHYHERIIENHQKELLRLKQKLNEKESL